MQAEQHVNTQEQRVMFPIMELACGGGGALQVERALAKLPGVTHAYVNPANETAYVRFDPSRCDLTKVIAAIESSGFRAGRVRTQ